MEYDVIVCGGGIAGVSAALAAARNGANTLLIEREYALGGLATLGLVCVYLPLCDGRGTKMSSGISEELLKLSLKYGPGKIPDAWTDDSSTADERAKERYMLTFNPASFVLSAEEELLNNNVKILYGAQISEVGRKDGKLSSVFIETKTGRKEIPGKTFVDATGDADICFFAGEQTVECNNNRRTGWYFSYDDKKIELHQNADPLYTDIPTGSRIYSGIDTDDISHSCIDGRAMIKADIMKKRKTNPSIYPLIIPSFHGLRMTRRLKSEHFFSTDSEGVYFDDTIGMIGNWKTSGERYTISLKVIEGVANDNLYAAGRCVSADEDGQDLTRVIPSCAVTGEAAGTIAAYQSQHGEKPSAEKLRRILNDNGVLLDRNIFYQKDKTAEN